MQHTGDSKLIEPNLSEQLGNEFTLMADKALEEQKESGGELSKETLQALHNILMKHAAYNKSIRTKVTREREIITLLETTLILYKHGIDTVSNFECVCATPSQAYNVSGAFLELKNLGLQFTAARKQAITENASHAFSIMDPIKQMQEHDKLNTDGEKIFTETNEHTIYQHAKNAEDIGSALSYLISKNLVITQSVFDAVIILSSAGMLSKLKPAIHSDTSRNPFGHIFLNLDALDADPEYAKETANAMVRLHKFRLLDSGFHPVDAREFILSVDAKHIEKAAELIIQLRYATILTQENLDKILRHPDKIDIILKKFTPLENPSRDTTRFNQAMLDNLIEKLDKKATVKERKPSLFKSHSTEHHKKTPGKPKDPGKTESQEGPTKNRR